MDLFDGIGRGIAELSRQAKDAGKKLNYNAKEASKSAKIKMELRELEIKLDEVYRELGLTYYKEMRNQSHKTEKTSADILFQLDDLNKEREALENLLKYREVQEQTGVVICMHCGAKIDKEANFCSKCGQEVSGDIDFIEYHPSKETTCPNCNYKIPEGASYCPACGFENREE